MVQLTEQFHVPREHQDACERLNTLVETHVRRLLGDEYWADHHLEQINEHTGQSYTYVRDDDYEPFAGVDEYVYNRFKRCVYARVTQVLDAHVDEYNAFKFVLRTVEEQKIRRIGWQRLRDRLFNDDSAPYIEWSVLESVVSQLNEYYDTHGRFPESYTELVSTPEPNGTLPYAPDTGDYHIHDLSVEDNEVVFTMNAPDSLSPESYHDWSDHEIRFPTHQRFQNRLKSGDIGAPTLHASEHGFTLDVPVSVPEKSAELEEDRILSVDLGVKKQATMTAVERDDRNHNQVAPPQFIDHAAKDKLFRLKADAEGINERLSELRKQGKSHTERFDHLLSEYRRTRRKERRLRQQVQHDVANQLVWAAIEHECETIVFESLGQLNAGDAGGAVSWSISSWARGELLDLVEYKAELVGIEVATVNPWGTSRHCPRCGEKGRTVKAPDNHVEQRHGGHFHCPHCEYECDRDVVGALNVGRKYFDDCKMELANPVAYMETGKHASFSSRIECARSTGVQSTTDSQEQASGRQTQRFHSRLLLLTAKQDGTMQGGLRENHGSNTSKRVLSGSITRYVLASTPECD